MNQFILGGYDGDNIVSVLVFLVLGDILSFPHIKIPGDFAQEDSKGDNNNTPCVIDDIPYARNVFFDSYELRTQLDCQALEHCLHCVCVLIQGPIKL